MDEKWLEIKDLFDNFSSNYAQYLLDDQNYDDLKQSVLDIEEKYKEIITESGFVEAQKEIHDLSIQLPTMAEKKGKFDSTSLKKYIENINEIIDIAKPGARSNVGYDIVAVAPGSSIILCDFDTKTKSDEQAEKKSINDTCNTLRNILDSSSSFSEPGFTYEKLNEFCEKTNLDEDKAYKISKTLSNIFPEPNDEADNVKLSINSKEMKFTREFKKDDRIKSIKTRQDIYNKIKPPENETITGKLGIMEEWDENHKISLIEADTFKIFTTNYFPSEQNIEIIKHNIGKTVTIKRSKDDGDKRKWFLDEWIEYNKT